jgi:hypothetical protein
MTWLNADSRSNTRVRALVHKECKDKPHPDGATTKTRPQKPPYFQQPISITQTEPADAITVTAATFNVTGTTSATLAQIQSNGRIDLTGTNFTSRTYGRVMHNSTSPKLRVTTFVGATSLNFLLDALDLNAGTISVGAAKINAGTQVSAAIAVTVT